MSNRLCVGLVAAVAGGYLLRREGLRWGATDEEVHSPSLETRSCPTLCWRPPTPLPSRPPLRRSGPGWCRWATTEPVSTPTPPGGTNTQISTSDLSGARKQRSPATDSEKFRVTNGSSLSTRISRKATPSSTHLPAQLSSRCAS